MLFMGKYFIQIILCLVILQKKKRLVKNWQSDESKAFQFEWASKKKETPSNKIWITWLLVLCHKQPRKYWFSTFSISSHQYYFSIREILLWFNAFLFKKKNILVKDCIIFVLYFKKNTYFNFSYFNTKKV